MSLPRVDWTLEMVHALPDDGNRYELIDGELYVTPAPSFVHQRAIMRLYSLLVPYADALSIDVLIAPAAVTFSKRRELQPDLLCMPRLPDGRLADTFTDVGRLLLAVEVLSPGSVRTDTLVKRPVYQHEQVPDYWIVDARSRSVERWTPTATGPERLSTTLLWQPLPPHAALTVDLVQYFRSVFGE